MTSRQIASVAQTVNLACASIVLAVAFCSQLLAQATAARPEPRAAALEALGNDSVLLGSYLRAVALGDTGLIIADSRAGRLLVFDGKVRLVRALAHPGEGPGEFRIAASVGRFGEEPWLFDPTQGRLTRFSKAGELVYSQRLAPPQHSPGPYLGGVVIGAQSDSVFIWEFDVAQVALAGAAPVRHSILVTGRDGSMLDTLASFDRQSETWPISGSLGRTAILPNPFTYSPVWRALPNGAGVVVVIPDQNPSRTGGAFTLEWHLIGLPVSRISVPYRPQLLRTAWADSMVERVAEPVLLAGGFSLEDVKRAMEMRLRLPTYLPPVTALLTSDDGSAWIRREDPSWTQVEWSVWSPERQLVASFSVPSNVRGIAASGNVLWAVQEDSSGDNRVVKYRY